MSQTLRKATSASYVAKMRKVWANCGFKQTSLMVHERDRLLLMAKAEVLRFDRLLESVEGGDTEAIKLAATRNMPKLPTYDVISSLEGDLEHVEDEKAASEVRRWLKACSTHSKHCNAARVNAAEDPLDDAMFARAICHGYLANASMKVADALLEDYYSKHEAA